MHQQLGLRTERCRLGSAKQRGARALNISEATGAELFDAHRFIVKLSIPTTTVATSGGGDLFFQAPSQAIAYGLQRALAKHIDAHCGLANPHSRKKMRRRTSLDVKATTGNNNATTDMKTDEVVFKKEAALEEKEAAAAPQQQLTSDAVMHHDEDEDVEGLMDWPTGAGAVAAHLILLPLKAAL